MDQQYKTEVSQYQKKDAIIAICFWFMLMALFAVAGMLGGLYATITSFILLIACIAIVLLRKQGLSSLGLGKKNLLPSLGAGLLFGVLYITAGSILPGIIYGWKLESFGFLLYELMYLVVVIALVEEVLFRGYIQTRLYGLFKNDVAAVAMGGLLFALMHAPYQLISGNRVFDFWFVIWLALTFLLHIIFNSLYRKYNSIYGPVILHALWNYRGSIFVADNPPEWYGYIALTTAIVVAAVLGIIHLHKRKVEKTKVDL